jgi:hypothetical protein
LDRDRKNRLDRKDPVISSIGSDRGDQRMHRSDTSDPITQPKTNRILPIQPIIPIPTQPIVPIIPIHNRPTRRKNAPLTLVVSVQQSAGPNALPCEQ